MAGYEYNLRRLFRPPIDNLPLKEQLNYYEQRDLIPSHLYRLGTRLLGGAPLRRRVIDTSLYVPPEGGVPHSRILGRSRDGQTLRKDTRDKLLAEVPSDSPGSPCQFTGTQYRDWLRKRQRLRADLKSLGASEQWLLSKDRTPLESTLLAHIQRGREERLRPDVESEESLSSLTPPRPPSPQDPLKPTGSRRKQLLKEVNLLQTHLSKHRRRLVTLLMTCDKQRDRLITAEDLRMIAGKLKVSTTDGTMDVVVHALQIATGRADGRIDYRLVLSGNTLKAVVEYFDKLDATEGNSDEVAAVSDDDSLPETGETEEEVGEQAELVQRYRAPSTMEGEIGRLADEVKEESLRQFMALVSYCKERGVVLSWRLAERALLMPPDQTKKECLTNLRQPGLDLLSAHFADPPEIEDKVVRTHNTREEFGGAYKQLRRKTKPRLLRLSTGNALVNTKIDCWMTFEEFQRLTQHITSRPGFIYKYHGLPENNAFWPGALLDKMRLWLPTESLLDKPTSLYNIFQSVQHPRIYNPFSPMVHQKTSWPDNEAGYVQFGSQSRKAYHL